MLHPSFENPSDQNLDSRRANSENGLGLLGKIRRNLEDIFHLCLSKIFPKSFSNSDNEVAEPSPPLPALPLIALDLKRLETLQLRYAGRAFNEKAYDQYYRDLQSADNVFLLEELMSKTHFPQVKPIEVSYVRALMDILTERNAKNNN